MRVEPADRGRLRATMLGAVVMGSFGSVMFPCLVGVMALDARIAVVTPLRTGERRVRRRCQGERGRQKAQQQY